jgi:ABC-type transport system substrate-binding protein
MKPANFPGIIFAIYSDVTTAHNAFLGYTVDWNAMSADQNLALYEADPKLTVYRFTEDTGKPSLVYQYMGYNNHKYNATWRQAMSYAINYTYVIDVLRLGNAFRGYSAISPGFGAAWNSSISSGPYAIDYDLNEARTIIQSMGIGLGLGLSDDAAWIAVADGSTPFLTVPHTYNTGNAFREDYQVAITAWYKLIGVKVVDDGVTFNEFLGYLYDDYDHLGIYAIGWAPDYLDPYNMLDPLFNPASSSNSAQVDDAHLNALMASALAETDEGARNTIYQNIQGYLARMQFHAPLYHSRSVYTHAANLYNVPYNAMGALRIYPVYRGLYDPFNV